MAQRMYSLFEPDELQYGFAHKQGCQRALFTMQTVINYYTTRGSPTILAKMGASKSFDHFNHFGRFCKLNKLGVPLYLLNLIVSWHLKQDLQRVTHCTNL